MDVVVVGGGIVGCSAAAFLAEAGARVTLLERERIGAAASGRNQGVLQHPMDDVLVPLYRESLELHRETYGDLGQEPAGLLFVSRAAAVVEELAASLGRAYPELAPSLVEDASRVEPALAPGTAACGVATGQQVAPLAVTGAWAERARAAGVSVEIGRSAAGRPEADAVLWATGPWAPVRVASVWGVTVQVKLARPPLLALEEAEIGAIATLAGALPAAFSSVTAAGVTTIGSTFLPGEPDVAALVPGMLERAARFVPGVAAAAVVGSRACARPVSPDGRPMVGRLPGGDWVATGNGPWGMSCGPATARVVADAILGRSDVPAALDVRRIG